MLDIAFLDFCLAGFALMALYAALCAKLFAGRATILTPVMRPIERQLYRLAGVDGRQEQGWLAYTMAMLTFNAAGFVAVYALQRLQAALPLKPPGFASVQPDLAFNSFDRGRAGNRSECDR